MRCGQRAVLDAVKAANELEILGGLEVGIETRFLGHVANQALIVEELGLDVFAVPFDLAARGPQQTDQHLHRRALARAIGPEQTDDLAWFRRHAEHAHGGDPTIALGYIDHVEHASLLGWRSAS